MEQQYVGFGGCDLTGDTGKAGEFSLLGDRKEWWTMHVTKHFFIQQQTRPNWFHRTMMRLAFGFKWTKGG